MPTRYVALTRRPSPVRSWDLEPEDERQSIAITVHEPERNPVDTGILDQHGTTIYRVDEPEPIGFRSRK